MDLFHMRRYWSHDQEMKNEKDNGEEEEVNQQQQQQNSILEKLNKKTKSKRKRTDDDDDVENFTPQSLAPPHDEKKKKTKKKKKLETKGVANGGDDGVNPEGFTILGQDMEPGKNRKVRGVLPHWLANPDIVSVDLSDNQMTVETLDGIEEDLKKRLKEKGVDYLFPVQRQIIPWLIHSQLSTYYRPRDICVSAPTGSGKTLAFVLPILAALKHRVVPRIRALVILPVQDLALQVYQVFQDYNVNDELRIKLLSSGQKKSFKEEQKELVREGVVGYHSLVDILVATPGRLVDHIQNTAGFSLEYLRYLVVDEADRVMEDIQNDWLKQLESSVYVNDRKRPGPINVVNSNKCELPLQKLLFSATLSQNPEKLQEMNLHEPKLFTSVVQPKDILNLPKSNQEFVGQFTTPLELTEFKINIKDPMKKPLVLQSYIKIKNMSKVLVFTKSTDNAHYLSVLLSAFGLQVGEISSLVHRRNRVLNKFKSGNLNVLVCTDALARGIDIGTIDYVISYDCPQFIRTYIHRVGRTARAGQPGTAITILEKSDARTFTNIMNEASKDLDKIKELEDIDEDNLDMKDYEEKRDKASSILLKEKSDKSSKNFKKNKKKNKK